MRIIAPLLGIGIICAFELWGWRPFLGAQIAGILVRRFVEAILLILVTINVASSILLFIKEKNGESD